MEETARLSRSKAAVAVAGLSLCWAFFPLGHFSSYFTSTEASLLCNEIVLALSLVAALLAVAFRRPLEKIVFERRCLVFAFIECGLAGYALLWAVSAFSLPFPVMLFALAILALSYVIMLLSWLCVLSRVEWPQAGVIVALSTLLYALITMIAFLPAPVIAVAYALMPAASGACWLAIRRPADTGLDYSLGALKRLPHFELGLFALFLIGGRIVIGLYHNQEASLSLVEFTIRCACIMGLVAYFAFALRRSFAQGRRSQSIWMPAAMLFLLGALIIIGFGSGLSTIGSGITSAAMNGFEALAYISLLQFAAQKRVSPLLTMGAGFIVFKVLPTVAQRFAVSKLVALLGIPEEQFMPIIMLVVMAVVASILAFFNRAMIRNAEAQRADREPGRAPLEEACRAIAEEAGLSARESEIMSLIAQGHSQKHISEVLCLSLGTVQWHAKNIYSKLGIHSKQELINKANARL